MGMDIGEGDVTLPGLTHRGAFTASWK